MGFYIEVPVMQGKAEKIEKIFNAKRIPIDVAALAAGDATVAVICVVENPNFEAAAFCHSFDEFRRFTHPADNRPKTWLVAEDREMIEKVTGYEQAKLNEELEELGEKPA